MNVSPTDESGVAELCLSHVEIPGDSPAMTIEEALAVTKLIFGEEGAAALPAIRTLAWDHEIA